jgi:FKBP-type peptidyl-prolyl cis-trans isomerase SlyD
MKPQIVCFKCVLKDNLGNFISSSVNKDVLTAAPVESARLSGLSKGLEHLKKGEKRKIALAANEAYGFYRPEKVILLPRRKLCQSEPLRIGQAVSAVSKTGQAASYKILEFYGEMVSVDGNHPLAGRDLIFEIEALDVRDATTDEIAAAENPVASQHLH